MGIQGIDPYPPIKGTIRLGVRQEARSGSKYPKDSEYFILKDAPDVKRFYGDEPKALHIIFPSGFIDEVIPTWFKKYSASVMSGDEVIHGKLVCFGNGPAKDGVTPGVATWKDKTRMPKEEGAVRNPHTGFVTRPCLGKTCPDAYDGKGNRVCKQTMKVLCILPLVSMVDLYEINTSSWNSINSFHGLLRWHHKLIGPDYIKTNFYQVERVETAIPYVDPAGAPKTGIHHVIQLSHLNKEAFLEQYADKLRDSKARLEAGTFFTGNMILPPEEDTLMLPMDELYPLLDSADDTEVQPEPVEELSPLQKAHLRADELLNDPEMLVAFAEFERATDKPLTLKSRKDGILRKMNYPDMKQASLEAMYATIRKMEKVKPKDNSTPEEAPPAVPEIVDIVYQSKAPLEHIEVTVSIAEHPESPAEPVPEITMM